MNSTVSSPVVVGVDGTTANRGALRYAAQEARRSGGGLRLVHVVPDYVPISPMMPLLPGDLTETGAAILSQVEDEVRAHASDVPVESWLRHGSRATELVRAAADAGVLVVGRDDRPVVTRLVDGDTATRTAARATVPVVEVPPRWHADVDPVHDHGVVLVGVKSPAHADALLGQAFAAARERSARLTVLHAWHLPSAYDDLIEGRVAREQIRQEGTAEVEQLLEHWRTGCPEVDVEVRIVHDRPAHALLEASASADLVIIVRRGHGVPAATHLGGTARAVLRNAECPVMVVPPTPAAEAVGLILESEGQLLR